jgi:hypothetical protein
MFRDHTVRYQWTCHFAQVAHSCSLSNASTKDTGDDRFRGPCEPTADQGTGRAATRRNTVSPSLPRRSEEYGGIEYGGLPEDYTVFVITLSDKLVCAEVIELLRRPDPGFCAFSIAAEKVLTTSYGNREPHGNRLGCDMWGPLDNGRYVRSCCGAGSRSRSPFFIPAIPC